MEFWSINKQTNNIMLFACITQIIPFTIVQLDFTHKHITSYEANAYINAVFTYL